MCDQPLLERRAQLAHLDFPLLDERRLGELPLRDPLRRHLQAPRLQLRSTVKYKRSVSARAVRFSPAARWRRARHPPASGQPSARRPPRIACAPPPRPPPRARRAAPRPRVRALRPTRDPPRCGGQGAVTERRGDDPRRKARRRHCGSAPPRQHGMDHSGAHLGAHLRHASRRASHLDGHLSARECREVARHILHRLLLAASKLSIERGHSGSRKGGDLGQRLLRPLRVDEY